jgi:hypothetical protein
MSLRYIFEQDQLIADFVAQMIPHCRERGFGRCRAIGVADADNELIAGLVYHHLNPEAELMEVSCAALPGRRWLTNATLTIGWDYPFIQCRCQMVAHTVLAENESLLRQLVALGCTLTRFPRMFGRHRDGVACLLTDDAWRGNRIFRRAHRWRDEEKMEAA